MDEKKEKCKRCGSLITPKTKRAEFCSQKCKVYWHREKKRGLNNLTKPNLEVKPFEQPQTNFIIDTEKIKELQDELGKLNGTSTIVTLRRRYLENEIYRLKHPRL